MAVSLLVASSLIAAVGAVHNGLAITPAMGWSQFK
jgi:hypothetical protein